MRLAFLYLIFINLIDFVTTSMLINKFGFWIEGNPLLYNAMVHTDSVYPILLAKIIPLFIFGLFMWIMKVYRPDRYKLKVWLWSTIIINISLTGVVIRSIYAIYNI